MVLERTLLGLCPGMSISHSALYERGFSLWDLLSFVPLYRKSHALEKVHSGPNNQNGTSLELKDHHQPGVKASIWGASFSLYSQCVEEEVTYLRR